MFDWKKIKEYEDIIFEEMDGIAKITINRPEVYNAFRPKTNMEMLEAFSICRERQDIRVIVLTGAGDKAFCVVATRMLRVRVAISVKMECPDSMFWIYTA